MPLPVLLQTRMLNVIDALIVKLQNMRQQVQNNTFTNKQWKNATHDLYHSVESLINIEDKEIERNK